MLTLLLLYRIPQTAVPLMAQWAPEFDFSARFILADNAIHPLDCVIA